MEIMTRSGIAAIPTPAMHAKLPGSSERFFSGAGVINASSKNDLRVQLKAMMEQVQQGLMTLASDEEHVDRYSSAAIAKRQEAFMAAKNDPTGRKWQTLGSSIGLRLNQTANREGFMRRLLLRGEVAQGALPRAQIRVKNVTAGLATGPSEMRAQYARDNYINIIPEFYIKANVRVEDREIQQGAADLMDNVFFNAQEQILVQEDKTWKSIVDGLIGIENADKILAGGLTPLGLVDMRSDVTRWNLPAATMVAASDVWNDIIGNVAVWSHNMFDPVTQLEIMQTGYLGSVIGLGIISDAYRAPQLKVLDQGDIYVLSTPEFHGGYTDRGPVNAVPTDGAVNGEPGRGWFMSELMSMVVHNARSFSHGRRS